MTLRENIVIDDLDFTATVDPRIIHRCSTCNNSRKRYSAEMKTVSRAHAPEFIEATSQRSANILWFPSYYRHEKHVGPSIEWQFNTSQIQDTDFDFR